MSKPESTAQYLQSQIDALRQLVCGSGDRHRDPPEAPPGEGPSPQGEFARPSVVAYLAGRARFWRRKEREWTRQRAKEDARLLAVQLESLADAVYRAGVPEYDRTGFAGLLYGAASQWRIERRKVHRARQRYDCRIVAEELEKLARCVLEEVPVEVG